MKNNQNSIKNFIRKYFLKADSDIEELNPQTVVPTTVTVKRQPPVYKKMDISKNITNPQMARSMKALQLSNPFKGV